MEDMKQFTATVKFGHQYQFPAQLFLKHQNEMIIQVSYGLFSLRLLMPNKLILVILYLTRLKFRV